MTPPSGAHTHSDVYTHWTENRGAFRLIIAMRKILMAALASALTAALLPGQGSKEKAKPFEVVETTIDQIHAAYKTGRLTARQLVQAYLDRIGAYDQQGPKLNAIIALNPKALEDADRLDAQYKTSGPAG